MLWWSVLRTGCKNWTSYFCHGLLLGSGRSLRMHSRSCANSSWIRWTGNDAEPFIPKYVRGMFCCSRVMTKMLLQSCKFTLVFYSLLRFDYTETVDIEFDPLKTNYSKLIDIFWKNHDPTVPCPRQVSLCVTLLYISVISMSVYIIIIIYVVTFSTCPSYSITLQSKGNSLSKPYDEKLDNGVVQSKLKSTLRKNSTKLSSKYNFQFEGAFKKK